MKGLVHSIVTKIIRFQLKTEKFTGIVLGVGMDLGEKLAVSRSVFHR